MDLYFNDISVLYQFVKSDLFCLSLKLDYKLYTTDLVYYSQQDDQETSLENYISNGTVTILSLNEKQMSELYALHQAYCDNVSISDCSVCYLALKKEGIVISNDLSVIELATNKNIKHKKLNLFINDLELQKTA